MNTIEGRLKRAFITRNVNPPRCEHCFEQWNSHRDGCVVDEAIRTIATLREVLGNRDVEWSSGPERNKCPWCNGLYEEHRPNCERQKALWREEECDCEGIILKAGGHRVDCPLNEAEGVCAPHEWQADLDGRFCCARCGLVAGDREE